MVFSLSGTNPGITIGKPLNIFEQWLPFQFCGIF